MLFMEAGKPKICRGNIPAYRPSGRKILFYLGEDYTFILFSPSADWMRPPTLWRANGFAHYTDLNINFIPASSEKHPE